MFRPDHSLLKFDNPILFVKDTDRKVQKGRHLAVNTQLVKDSGPIPRPPKSKSTTAVGGQLSLEEILRAIFPPREWKEGNQVWIQQVSTAPCTREDVLTLETHLEANLQKRQARMMGICPVRSEIYAQCFDELIRQVTVSCAERGRLLSQVRNEIQMTITAYRTLYASSIAFGIRKALQAEQKKADTEQKLSDLETEIEDLKKQLIEQKQKYESVEKTEAQKRQQEERKHLEEIQFLKETNKQLKTQLEGIVAPKK